MEFSDETPLITGAAGNLVAAVAVAVAEVMSARGARLLQRYGQAIDRRLLFSLNLLQPAEVQEAVHGAH